MPNDSVAGFWSYAHDDNELDGGAILNLAHLIMDEYNLLSGESLQLFIDRSDVSWGDEWRTRIDLALTRTTFFIPIITPRYFVREECRRELLEFAGKAKSLGVDELLLPILYALPQGFSGDNPDEAIALVARTHYVDWRAIRLQEASSREYRTQINALARRLQEIAERVAENQFRREIDTASGEDNGDDGIAELIEDISRLLPDWLDTVMGDKVNRAQMGATFDLYLLQISKLKRAKASASAILSAKIRSAKELLPLAERAQRDGRVYLSRSVQLDPLISALTRRVGDHPDTHELIQPIREAINEAMVVIRQMDKPLGEPYSTIFGDMKHAARIFQKCNAVFTDAGRLATEGNEIVRRWDAELRTALGSE
jgi:hypothetical protein